MKPFVFAERLGMVGTGVNGPNPKPNQPSNEGGVAMLGVGTPGRSVVHQDAFGQSIAAERLGEAGADGGSGLVGASLKGY